jgi:hypothetical protein
MITGITIDYETADRITLATLIECRKYREKELKEHLENGAWMHPDDVENSTEILKHLTKVIEYFGGYDK